LCATPSPHGDRDGSTNTGPVDALRRDQPGSCADDADRPHGFSPLSDEESEELEAFLMEDRAGAEAMMLDTMDGYMHALAIGPTSQSASARR
jgi:hypothetical protein